MCCGFFLVNDAGIPICIPYVSSLPQLQACKLASSLRKLKLIRNELFGLLGVWGWEEGMGDTAGGGGDGGRRGGGPKVRVGPISAPVLALDCIRTNP